MSVTRLIEARKTAADASMFDGIPRRALIRESLQRGSNSNAAKAPLAPGSRLPIAERIAIVGKYFKTCGDMKKLDELLPAA
jgi:hypothetical protein